MFISTFFSPDLMSCDTSYKAHEGLQLKHIFAGGNTSFGSDNTEIVGVLDCVAVSLP